MTTIVKDTNTVMG